MKTVIISGGKAPSLLLLKNELKDADILICADSGGNFLKDSDIIPDYLVGDFDSINDVTLEHFKNSGCKVLEYPKDKDFTDTELALELAVKVKSDSIVLLGCTGTRIDHMIGNLGLLRTCISEGIEAFIKDDNNSIMLADKSLKIKGKPGSTFSVQAFSEAVANLTIKGAKYTLDNHKLRIGDPRTISNQFLNEEVSLDFSSGLLMVLYCND
jgi:thiamine pyrophosphokinase